MSQVKHLNVGIIGHGFVGKATEFGFSTPLVNKFIVDPNYKTTIDEMYDNFVPDVVFIAVPTPMGDDGTIDSRIIESVFTDLAKHSGKHSPIAVIKSTITPKVIQKLEKIYPRVVYNPEFLTERNANQDFIHAEFLVLGGRSKTDLIAVEEMYAQYSQCDPCPVFKVDLEAASMVKYTLNCFMATKVLFFNQINDVYRKCGTDTPWEDFIDIMKADSRVGSTHMVVPGYDGKRGFGGACFPKDTAALVRYARDVDAPFTSLEEVVRANQLIRSQYTDLDQREKEQNVRFNVL
jgi:UDPglucose 6-dehydrogenase